MIYLLRGERYKINKDNLSKIMIVIYVIAGIFFFLQGGAAINESDFSDLMMDDFINVFSIMLRDMTQAGNEMKSTIIILCLVTVLGFITALFSVPIFTAISVTDEYLTKNIQQLVGKGISRYKIVLSKFLGISSFIILINVCMVTVGILAAIAYSGVGNVFEFIAVIICFEIKVLLMNVAFIAVCIFCSFMVKNSGFAIPLNYVLIILLLGEFADGLFVNSVIRPVLSFLLISLVFTVGTIIMFNKSDL